MRRDLTHTLVIRTPEGVSFALPLAGPVTRFFAWAIDFAVITASFMVLSTVLAVAGMLVPDFTQALLFVLYFAISIGYAMVLEWFWRGQTVGKRLLKIRVVDAQGLNLDFSQIAVRNLLRFIDSFPVFYLVGGVAMLVTRRAQRLGDLAADTIVIRRRPEIDYQLAQQAASGKFNSFRAHPHLEARLRQQTSPREALAALQALLRREQFEPRARVELMAEIAAHFRDKAAFPEDATFGLTGEQYVRNVVDTLFRARGDKSAKS